MPIPFKCPVCKCKQIVKGEFYDLDSKPLESNSLFPHFIEECRTCNGIGIVWSDPDFYYRQVEKRREAQREANKRLREHLIGSVIGGSNDNS